MNLAVIIDCISNAVGNVSTPFISGATLLKDEFKEYLNAEKSEIEYRLSIDFHGNCDRCDVYVEMAEYQIIIEIDATRTDQLAKKMLSRYYYAHTKSRSKPTVYVCLLYPGTESMNPNECIKYMNMGKEILLAMNPANRFIGGFINDRSVEWKNIG